MFIAKKSKSSSRKPIKIAHKVVVAEESKMPKKNVEKDAKVKVEKPVADVPVVEVEQAAKPAGRTKKNKANSEENSDTNKNEE